MLYIFDVKYCNTMYKLILKTDMHLAFSDHKVCILKLYKIKSPKRDFK